MSRDVDPAGSARIPEGKGRRIIYLSRHFGYPLGGVRIAHHHVSILRRNGFNALIMLVSDRKDDFFSADVPVEFLGPDTAFHTSDIIVIPEPWDTLLERFSRLPVRKLVFCQNHFYLYHGLNGRWSYDEFGVDRVFCCSEVIADYFETVFQRSDVAVVHNGIDQRLFRPGAKRRQIAYMPRKMQIEARFVKETYRRMHPDQATVPWVPISGVPETEVARLLGESAVFLALGRMEGFGLPPVEAMAAGCIVVGFTGDGGRAFATDRNGYWCAPDDWFGCAAGLAEAIAAFDRDGGQAMVTAGRATAAEYSLDRMEREVVAFWDAEVRQ